jgi:uncharacterized protein
MEINDLMDIQHFSNGQKGKFFVTDEAGNQTAEMTYVHAGEHLIIIDHTDVSAVLKGKGAGAQLVKAAVEMARAQQWNIMPLCPFAKSVFDKIPDYADVLK